VEFTLLDAEGRVLVPEQTLEQARVLSFDEQDILGAAQEDEQLRREMANTLARLVLRRLGTTRS
jgi:outer membrane lipopolysaccharide assembly protein LptE/RlpB